MRVIQERRPPEKLEALDAVFTQDVLLLYRKILRGIEEKERLKKKVEKGDLPSC